MAATVDPVSGLEFYELGRSWGHVYADFSGHGNGKLDG